MKKLFITPIIGLLAAASMFAQTLTPTNPPAHVGLAWDPSPSTEVSGYYIYYGPATGNYTNKVNAGQATSVTVSNLVRGVTYYFAATAYTAEGLESEFSNEVSWKPKTIPSPPANLKATNVVIKVSLESSPSAKGPWSEFAELYTGSEQPGFYRSSVSIYRPEDPKGQLLLAKDETLNLFRHRDAGSPPPVPR